MEPDRESVQLPTQAAAATRQKLGGKLGRLQVERLAQMDAEVLERNAL